ncbi:hypothetical protein PR048_013732 [Dryococelus australis]|uniref:DDE-1 domain-containing protein n=1 Tax=Dryococelus australis TaxID=614101 RepID=A0ABQ9HT52_9NEOP|nr:hypothetical protein PR048_013732 [Dryococelus australis]
MNDAIDDVLRGTAGGTAAKSHSVPRFEEINNYLKESNYENILEKPERVFNLVASAFFLNPKGNKVLRAKGEKNVYQQVNADEKECLTLLVTGNGNEDLAPTSVVFKYERVPHELADSVPKHWGIGKSETGWMTAPLFFEVITNIFYPFLVEKKIPLPVIVFIYGHASHLTLHTSKFCEDHGIILIALLPNLTHLIQPMDVVVFHVLKEAWKKKGHQWRMQHLNDPALKKCGLVLNNPAAVDTSKIPTMDAGPAVTNRSSLERLRAGKVLLERYIGEEDCFIHCHLQEDIQANESYVMYITEQNGENNNEENEEPCAANEINTMTQSNQWQLYHEKKKEAAMENGIQKQVRAEARKAKQEGRESAKKLKLQEKKKKIMGRKSKKISLDVPDTE